MKILHITGLLLLSASTSACMDVAGPGGIGAPPSEPPPPERAQLPGSVNATSKDYLTVRLREGTGYGLVKLCMTNAVKTDKGWSIGGGGMVRVEKKQTKCADVRAGPTTVGFWRRKPIKIKKVGSKYFDLTGYEGTRIDFRWTTD